MAGNSGSAQNKRVLSLVTNFLFDNVANREISAKTLSICSLPEWNPGSPFLSKGLVNLNGRTSLSIVNIYQSCSRYGFLKKPNYNFKVALNV